MEPRYRQGTTACSYGSFRPSLGLGLDQQIFIGVTSLVGPLYESICGFNLTLS